MCVFFQIPSMGFYQFSTKVMDSCMDEGTKMTEMSDKAIQVLFVSPFLRGLTELGSSHRPET